MTAVEPGILSLAADARLQPRAVARHPPCTIGELLDASVRAYPDAPAILAPEREPLTFEGLGRQLDHTAAALARAGFPRQSRIAVALPEGAEFAVASLAVCRCATCALLSLDLDAETLHTLIVAMKIDALIAPKNEDSAAVSAARRAGVAIIRLEACDEAPAGTFTLIVPLGRPPVAQEPPGVDDIALVTHTSGTTARPKIVPHTHRRIAEAARTRAELGRVTRRDRSLLLTPVSNVTSFRRVLLPPLVSGGSTVCVNRFEPDRFFDWLETMHPTYYMASAARQVAILEAFGRRSLPVRHSLRFALSGGANLLASHQSALERALGVPVIQSYGMNETGNITQAPLPPERAPPGSVGRPTNVDLVILGEDGSVLDADEIGEIVVRGPEIFDGYENDPEATAAAFRAGWFRTGDLGRTDPAGFLFLSGRVKDIINRGGTKVAPSEVEEALALHPDVAQVAAFALAHPTLGEDVAAAVVLRTGATMDEEALRNFAAARVAASKVPTRILTLTELPRGSFDKIRRDQLAKIAAVELRHEFVAPRDETESAVAQIFAEVLGMQRVGVFDNFFELGGDSLRAMRVLAQIESVFAVEISVEALFLKPTAAAFKVAIRDAERRGRAAPSMLAGPARRAQ